MPSGIYPRLGVRERFWAKVDRRGAMECWPWQGEIAPNGYGRFWLNGKLDEAHRVAYKVTRGPIPLGLTIDHLCRNRRCVNPMHLEAVSQRENLLRGNGPPGTNARKTSCPRGHPYSGSNLYLDSKGNRQCRICRRLNKRAWRRKQSLVGVEK
jgi:hypothetical protein